MIEKVIVNFNEDLGKSVRADETPSFQYFVKTLGDVPLVGDYVGMMTWSNERNAYSRRMVRVTARRIMYEPQPNGGYDETTDMTYYVTLMVVADSLKGGPDFRA